MVEQRLEEAASVLGQLPGMHDYGYSSVNARALALRPMSHRVVAERQACTYPHRRRALIAHFRKGMSATRRASVAIMGRKRPK
jgi:hypothetical protein